MTKDIINEFFVGVGIAASIKGWKVSVSIFVVSLMDVNQPSHKLIMCIQKDMDVCSSSSSSSSLSYIIAHTWDILRYVFFFFYVMHPKPSKDIKLLKWSIKKIVVAFIV